MRTVVLVQVRCGSTRFPNKILSPLLGQPLLVQLARRAGRTPGVERVVLICPAKDAPLLRPILDPLHLDLFADPGDEADLVGRHLRAAEWAQADLLVRVPGDNPCVDPVYLDAALAAYRKDPIPYYSNTTAAVGAVWVDGIGGEVVSRSRLQWLDARTTGRPDWREHPHRYFEDQGLLRLPPATIRLDVNTLQDYLVIRDLFTHFGHNQFTSQEVVQYLMPKGDPYAPCDR